MRTLRWLVLVVACWMVTSSPAFAYVPEYDFGPRVLAPVLSAVSPAPPLTPADLCAAMEPGLHVLSLVPTQPLMWVKAERAFRVGLCNANGGPMPKDGGLVAFITTVGQNHPMGQTYTRRGAIPPGYTEVVLEHWIPGLENHLTICVQKPAVIVEVKWSDDAKNDFRVLDVQQFPVQCGGDYA